MTSIFKHHIFIFLFGSIILSSCYSVKKTVENSKPNSEKINWPDDYKPEKAGFFVHNEIDIKAEPQVVWNILIKAEHKTK